MSRLAHLPMFGALPPFPGGKRRLLGALFKHIPPPSQAPVLADAFLGGGAVSLYAKARGYRVLCNDLAERSVVVGRALIENDRVQLSAADVLRLFDPALAGQSDGFVSGHLCPDVLPEVHGRFLDNARAALGGFSGTKRDLVKLLLVKYAFRLRPMGNFGAKSIVHQVVDGDFDAVTPAFLRGTFLDRVHAHPRTHVEALRTAINRGVFCGAGPCKAHQGDAAAFLRTVHAEIAYIDPPYATTTPYETALRPVDELLAGHALTPEPSAFSGAGWRTALEDLLDAAARAPTVVLSFGNVACDLDELLALMRRFKRHVHGEAIKYEHLASLASEESRARNLELIVVGRDNP